MINYSITYSVDKLIEHEWLAWMHLTFIPTLMESGFFDDYKMQELVHPTPQPGTQTYNLQFVCESRIKLKTYQKEHQSHHQHLIQKRYSDSVISFYTILREVDW